MSETLDYLDVYERLNRMTAERDLFLTALQDINTAIPSTKGMNPRDRAQRLHSVLEERIAIARDALRQRSYII